MSRLVTLLVLSFAIACARTPPPPSAPATAPAGEGGTSAAEYASQWNSPAGNCAYTCRAGATCNVSCAGGGCKVECKAGATCNGNCEGGRCASECSAGSTCKLAGSGRPH